MEQEQSQIEHYYNRWAERYDESARIEKARAETLLHLLHKHIWLLSGKGWIDIGCRSGQTLSRAAGRELIRPTGHWGFDPSERMVALARDLYPRLARWIVAEPLQLPLEDEEARGAFVNGGWQWSARAGRLEEAMYEARRVLRKNSLLALAHPGPGSDETLQEAVWETSRNNPAWHKGEFAGNPLGSRSLQSFLALASKTGFTVIHGEERYEPYMYANLSLYLEEIEYTSRAAWLLHLEEGHWDSAWEEVRERLAETTTDGFLRSLVGVYLILRAT